jgi:hypothetical protein
MRSFEVEEQIAHLGLEGIIKNGKKPKMLDVGCGKHMALARHLQNFGVNIEGLDEVCEKNYAGLIKQNISACWPEKGCIPRHDEFYDLVVTHQNPYLTESASEFRETNFLKLYVYGGKNYRERIAEVDKTTRSIFSEMMRVKKEEGVVIVYPAIILLEKYFKNIIPKGINVVHLEVRDIPEEDKTIWVEDHDYGLIEDDVSFLATHRTALYNPRTLNPLLRETLGLKE